MFEFFTRIYEWIKYGKRPSWHYEIAIAPTGDLTGGSQGNKYIGNDKL